jgi:hypothetical protein
LTGVILTLKGDAAERVIQLKEPGSLFMVNGGITLILDQNITLRGRSDNNAPLAYVVYGGTLEIKAGAKITGNTGYASGGGVYVSSSGTFTMSGGNISGNTASSFGGGVYVSSSGTFTMNGGNICGNTASSFGGGVYVSSSGTSTMSGGEISGNTASSSGDRVYVDYYYYFDRSGTFAMSGNGRVTQDNLVYLAGNATAITIGGTLNGTDPVAFIEVPSDPAWIGREVIKKSSSSIGTLPVDRFGFTGPWEAGSDGRLRAKAGSLDFGETRSAFINRGGIHLYRFTPAFNKSYNITYYTREEYDGYYNSDVYASVAWADGSGVLINRNNYYYGTGTTSSFVADRTGVDIITMVDSETYAGVYSVNYNELD